MKHPLLTSLLSASITLLSINQICQGKPDPPESPEGTNDPNYPIDPTPLDSPENPEGKIYQPDPTSLLIGGDSPAHCALRALEKIDYDIERYKEENSSFPSDYDKGIKEPKPSPPNEENIEPILAEFLGAKDPNRFNPLRNHRSQR
ncbi:MAG: hypothetical protein H8E27_15680 [Verrucomicrobia subdivision 3 bacterium]|nr:hypothetical protein [Limisphaerales bacterium]